METMKSARILTLSFLFLTLCILFSVKSTAQSQSISPSLEGTRWTETITSGLQITESVYVFLDKKTVHAAHTITTYAIYESKFDALTGTWKSVPAEPGTVFSTLRGEETGIYKQNGNSILMEFSVGYQIEARIENGRLVGRLISKAGWDRAWSAVKVSGNTGTKVERPNVSNDVFGPWGNYENLRSAIVKFFNDKLDKAAADGGYIANLKEDVSEDRPLSLGVYSVVNVMIADRLNEFFNKKIFKPEDFRPINIRKRRNETGNPRGDVTTGNRQLDEAAQNPEPMLSISSYIREIYIPVVQRVLSKSQ